MASVEQATRNRSGIVTALKWGVPLGGLAVLLTLGIQHGVCPSNGSIWISYTIGGLRSGAIYAMIALGYTMVYGVLQLLNFAHSEVFMIGTFAGLYSIKGLFGVTSTNHPDGIGGTYLLVVLLVAIVLAALASATTAVAMERVAYRPLRRRGASRLAYLITAIGVSLVLSNLFLLLDGKKHLGLPWAWPAIGGAGGVSYPTTMKFHTVFHVAGVPVNNVTILVVAVAFVMLLVLDLFVHRTRTGQGIRAVAEDPETASLLGVNVNQIIVITFLVGGLMAGVAGSLYGITFGQASFNIGFIPGIKAFTAAVLGGIGNIRGAMLGGLLLGLIENLGIACIHAQWKDVIAFMVLVGVLMFRPTGILGEQVGG
jgi:branched-chain amino acid transport system permease protein